MDNRTDRYKLRQLPSLAQNLMDFKKHPDLPGKNLLETPILLGNFPSTSSTVQIRFADYENYRQRPAKSLNPQLKVLKSNLSDNTDTSGTFNHFKKLKKVAPLQNQSKTHQAIQLESVPTIEPAKHSKQQNHLIYSYGANTHCGLVRPYNEDRVSIILNIIKPESKKNVLDWPDCSFFAIYDGHGGNKCAEYLRDHLHHNVVRDQFFPQDPKKALIQSIYAIEKQFIDLSLKIGEKSGYSFYIGLVPLCAC